jgi:hypothetical protein
MGVLWFINLIFFVIGSRNSQCCDVDWYQSEADKIKDLGFFPAGDTTWLSIFHNYLYPTLIHLLSLLGAKDRVGITAFQFLALMTVASLIYFRFVKNKTHAKFELFAILLGATIFLNYNFTAFGLTEGLCASLLLAYAYLLYKRTYISNGVANNYKNDLIISVLATTLWMVRPSFFWLAIATFFFISVSLVFSHGMKIQLGIKLLILGLINFSLIVPQLLISKNGSFLNRLFHFTELSQLEYLRKGVFRYTTNLSECGPVQLIFSPYGQDLENLNPRYLQNPLSQMAGFVARLVSGWDAFPSSVTYLPSYSFIVPLLVTMVSGIIFVSPLFLAWSVIKDEKDIKSTLIRLVLPLIFIISQLTIGFTHGEFRYNIAGWVFGFMCLFILIAMPRIKRDTRLLFRVGILTSFFFLVVGQMTLMYSMYWQKCVS